MGATVIYVTSFFFFNFTSKQVWTDGLEACISFVYTDQAQEWVSLDSFVMVNLLKVVLDLCFLMDVIFISSFTLNQRKGSSSVFKTLGRGNDKSSLSSYIRLFEPLVIKALKVGHESSCIFSVSLTVSWEYYCND